VPNLLDGSISLKFLLETRLQSESFDTLDDLLGIRVLALRLDPRPGNMSQNDPKTTHTYDVTHKKSATPNQKIFF